MAGSRKDANVTVNMSNNMFAPGSVCFMCTRSIHPFQDRFSRSTVVGQNYEILVTEFLALALELSVEDISALLFQQGQGRDMPFLLCENCEVGMAGITCQLFKELHGAQEKLARKLGEVAQILQSVSTFIGLGAVQSVRKLLGSKCKSKMDEIRFHLGQSGVTPTVNFGNGRHQPPSQFLGRGPQEHSNAAVRGQFHAQPQPNQPYASNSQLSQDGGQRPFSNSNVGLGISFNCLRCLQSFKDIEGCQRHEMKCQQNKNQAPAAVFTPEGRKDKSKPRVGMRNPVGTALSNPKNENKKTHECSVCGKSFNKKRQLSGHYSVHARAKPFPCSKCGNQFRTKGQLKTHEKICPISLNQNRQPEKKSSVASPATVKKLSQVGPSMANFSANVTDGTVNWKNREGRERETENSSNSTPAPAQESVTLKDEKLWDADGTGHDEFMTFYYHEDMDLGSNQGGYGAAFQSGGRSGVPVPNFIPPTSNDPDNQTRHGMERRVPQLYPPQSPRSPSIGEHGRPPSNTITMMDLVEIKQEANFE